MVAIDEKIERMLDADDVAALYGIPNNLVLFLWEKGYMRYVDHPDGKYTYPTWVSEFMNGKKPQPSTTLQPSNFSNPQIYKFN